MVEEIRKRTDDYIGPLLIKQLEIHNYYRAVSVVTTSHVNDSAVEDSLDFWGQKDGFVSDTPLLVLFESFVRILDFEVFLVEE
jgi:hypothetical protein